MTQANIVDALRRIGAFVTCTHAIGKGFPDLVFLYQGTWYVAECKNSFLGWKLTTSQKKFHLETRERDGQVLIFDGPESVILWASRINQIHVKQKRSA